MNFPTTGTSILGPEESTLRLEEPLGAGAFGFVFKARDITTGTLYAVKFPQYTFFGGDREKRAFLNEVRAAQEIQHSNVVRVFHVGVDSPDLPPYIVMEYLEDGTLQNRLDEIRTSGNTVDAALLRTWTNDLIEGITAINTKMLHRDLKPDNILMAENILKIGDFGLSKVISAMTRSRSFKGGQHILYMAPEGWKFEKNTIQLDMYAMGIVFYQIATLRYLYELPKDPSNIESIRNMHFYQQPKPMQTGTALPLGFSHVVTRMLEKNPKDRFLDWSEVKQAMENVWASQHTPESAPREAVNSLLHVAGQRYEEYTRQQIEERQRQEELKEQQQLDEVQKQRLIELIMAEIAEYNKNCHLNAKIREERIHSQLTFYLPFGGALVLRFFSVDPPLNLKIGSVRFAAVLQDTDKIGLNYLLCRKDAEDLYGTWRVCRVRNGVFSQPTRPDPFGFDNAKDIHNIESADQFATYYTNEFSDQIQDVVLEIAKNAMLRANNQQKRAPNQRIY